MMLENGTKSLSKSMVSLLALALLAACGSDDAESVGPLYQSLVETKKLTLMEGTPQLARFGPGERIELEVPANVVRGSVEVEVSLVTGTVRRGRHPVNDAGLLVQPEGLVFQAPVRVRQPVPPPPAGRTYVAVVIPDGETAFVARTPGRRVAPAGPDGLEVWEGEGDGSGLWGFALVGEDELDSGGK